MPGVSSKEKKKCPSHSQKVAGAPRRLLGISFESPGGRARPALLPGGWGCIAALAALPNEPGTGLAPKCTR